MSMLEVVKPTAKRGVKILDDLGQAVPSRAFGLHPNSLSQRFKTLGPYPAPPRLEVIAEKFKTLPLLPTVSHGFPGTVYIISFFCPSASRPSWAVNSYRLIVPASLQSQQLLEAVRCANAIHSWYYRAPHPPSDTPPTHSPIPTNSALERANRRGSALNDTAHSTTPSLLVSLPTPREPDSSPHAERQQPNGVRPSGKNGNAPATDDLASLHGNSPSACICDALLQR